MTQGGQPDPTGARPRSTDDAFISGIILAAGSSRRMGEQGPKQLLRHEGLTLLERVVQRAAESDLDELILVLGHEAEEIRQSLTLTPSMPLRIAVAPDYKKGQSRSLEAGLRRADPRAHAAAILLGDQPDLPTATINQARSAWLERRPPLLRPEYGTAEGRNEPGHPVMICRKIWPIIMELQGDQGAREVIRTHPDWLESLPLSGMAPADIDQSEDWQAWLESR